MPFADVAAQRYAKKQSRDCSWVAKKSAKRCKKKGAGKVTGFEACEASCCSCEEDDADWYFRKANQDCSWIAKKSKRCKKVGKDAGGAKVKAKDACKASCCGV